MASWPSSLPPLPRRQGFGERSSNLIATEMDAGTVKRRRRYSSRLRRFPVTLHLTSAQYSTFGTFFDTTLGGGVDAFDWVDFHDGSTVQSYAFVTDPAFSPAGGNTWIVRFELAEQP